MNFHVGSRRLQPAEDVTDLTHEFMRYAPELRDGADFLDKFKHNNVIQHLEYTASDLACSYIDSKSDNQVAT